MIVVRMRVQDQADVADVKAERAQVRSDERRGLRQRTVDQDEPRIGCNQNG